jgi:hypothetical protein
MAARRDARSCRNSPARLPETPMRFEKLKHGRGRMERSDWLGFMSTADHKTMFYLDNLELTNSTVE